ncbi:MAG: cohesin domain-containing protein [Oscillospiraceae bacterium]|nr:cohesin domain-containing protein [Oscillospiraceae bacterium]
MKTIGKKLTAMLLVLALTISMMSAVVLADGGIQITVGTVSGEPGQTVRVDVTIANNPGFHDAQLRFDLDAGLTLTAFEGGLSGVNTVSPNVAARDIMFESAAFGTDFTGNGVLVTLVINIADTAAAGARSVSVSRADFGNYDMATLSTTAAAGTVNVTGSGSQPPHAGSTVIVSFEGFNLGHSFYVEPTRVTVPDGSSTLDAARAALEQRDIEYTLQHDELSRISDVNPNWNAPPNPPSYIAGRPFGPHGGPAYSIGTGSYFSENQAPWSNQIQWRVTVNHHLRQQRHEIADGDVIRFMMGNTMRWPRDNCDLGLTPNYGGSTHADAQPPLYEHANKTALIRALFEEGVNPAARQAALDVIINPLATPAQVASALSALQGGGGSGDEIEVIVSFEGFNLGHGFYVEPTRVTVPAGSSSQDAVRALINRLPNVTHSETWGLDRLHGIHPGIPGSPRSYHNVTFGAGPADGSLGSFDYTAEGGWVHTINHFQPGVGWADTTLTDGAVIRWIFSVEGWGSDLGITEEFGGGGSSLYEHADKTALIRALYTPGISSSARSAALSVIINPLATPAQVASALTQIEGGGDGLTGNTLEDIYDNLENMSYGQILAAVEALDLDAHSLNRAIRGGSSLLDTFGAIEEAFANGAGISVGVNVNSAPAVFMGSSQINIVGAAFNANPGANVSLVLTNPARDVSNRLDNEIYRTANAVFVNMTLSGAASASNLDVPAVITLPIPNGLTADNTLRILHFTDTGYQSIQPIVGGGTAAFAVDGFSEFAMVNRHRDDYGVVTATVMRGEPEDPADFEVEIEWGDMVFTFDHEKGWVTEDLEEGNNAVTVTNLGRGAIDVAFDFTMTNRSLFNAASGANNVVGGFYPSEAAAQTASEILENPASHPAFNTLANSRISLPTAEGRNPTAPELTRDVFFAFSGSPDEEASFAGRIVGIITLNFYENASENLNIPGNG